MDLKIDDIPDETITALQLTGFTADDAYAIGLWSMKKRGLTKRQIEMVSRDVPMGVLNEGAEIIKQSQLTNGITPAIWDAVLGQSDVIFATAKERIARANAMVTVIEYMKQRDDAA